MKNVKAECLQCGEVGIISNSRGICVDCVFKNNHGGKSKIEVGFENRRERKRLKLMKGVRSRNKPLKITKTGELELFKEIWEERPHYCENKSCRKFLGNILRVVFFSHRKSKGAYPELRLVKSNIDLLCPDCHHVWDFGDKTKIEL